MPPRTQGLVTREMREEIFCQLIRMLYRNGGAYVTTLTPSDLLIVSHCPCD
jgi:hypothetical protein